MVATSLSRTTMRRPTSTARVPSGATAASASETKTPYSSSRQLHVGLPAGPALRVRLLRPSSVRPAVALALRLGPAGIRGPAQAAFVGSAAGCGSEGHQQPDPAHSSHGLSY